MRIEAMPVVLARDRIVRPVRRLGIEEDDPRARVLEIGVGPHVVVAVDGAALRAPGALEPRMLIRRVVDHELGDHPQPARVRLADEAAHVRERAVVGMHAAVVGDVVAVVAARRRIERQQPHRVDAELRDVVELRDQAGEIADAVVVGVEERLHVQLVDDRILVPQRRVGDAGRFSPARAARPSGHVRDELRAADVFERVCGLHRSCTSCAGTSRASSRAPRATPAAGATRQIANGRTCGSSAT